MNEVKGICSGTPTSARLCERYLQLALDNLPAANWYSSPDGSVEYVNKRWQEYTGLTLEQSIGDGWMEAVYPEDIELARERRVSAQPGEDLDIEMRVRRRDGVYRWFHVRVGMMLDANGKIVRRYGVDIDIEDQKQIDAARSRAERYLTDAQRMSKTGSFVVNFTTKEHLWSAETYRIYEYEQGIQPTGNHVLDRVHPDDRAMLANNFARRDERQPLELRYRLLFPDGRIKYIHVMGMPDESSFPGTTYIGALMDVTDVSLAEDALHRVHAALAQTTRASTLGELAASIAHEVNQPLAGIVSNGEASLRWLNRPKPDFNEARDSLRQIIADGQRAAEVIKRLRALARNAAPEFLAININSVLVEIVPLVQRELTQHGATLKLSLAADLPDIMGDKIQLQQVIINLISNGIQAMGAGGVNTQLEIRSSVDIHGNIAFAVSDSGTGISPEAVDALFNSFFTTKTNGMGMGLSICRSIVEGHGGTIVAKNNNGPGATVTVAFPLAVRAHRNE